MPYPETNMRYSPNKFLPTCAQNQGTRLPLLSPHVARFMALWPRPRNVEFDRRNLLQSQTHNKSPTTNLASSVISSNVGNLSLVLDVTNLYDNEPDLVGFLYRRPGHHLHSQRRHGVLLDAVERAVRSATTSSCHAHDQTLVWVRTIAPFFFMILGMFDQQAKDAPLSQRLMWQLSLLILWAHKDEV